MAWAMIKPEQEKWHCKSANKIKGHKSVIIGFPRIISTASTQRAINILRSVSRVCAARVHGSFSAFLNFFSSSVCDCWCCVFDSVQIMVNTLHGRTTQHNTTRNKNEELIQFYFDVNFIHIHIGDMSCVCALFLAHVSHLKHVSPEPPE